MSEEKKEETKNKPAKKTSNKKLAAIQVRGLIGSKKGVKDTMKMLNLQKKHSLIIIEDTKANRGMLKKCTDYITYGEVDEATVKKVKKERDKGKKYFNLHPPRGGFNPRGIKKHFNQNGALGYRGEAIKDLIMKMV